mgnify:CR=1 FL=1
MRAKHLAPDGCLKPGLKIIGGKQGQTKVSVRSVIYSELPDGLDSYIEPFLGSGSVVVGKPRHSIETVGDINPWVINYFNVVRDNPGEFWDELSRRLCNLSEETFQSAKAQLSRFSESLLGHHVNLAVDYYIVTKLANNGIVRYNKSGSCNSTFCKTVAGRGFFTQEWLKLLSDRIQGLEFLHADYVNTIQHGLSRVKNLEKSLIYVDSPYMTEFTEYFVKWRTDDHLRLKSVVDELSAFGVKFLISYNNDPRVLELYKGYLIHELDTHWCCSNTSDGRGVKVEYLISNYRLKNLHPIYTEPVDREGFVYGSNS